MLVISINAVFKLNKIDNLGYNKMTKLLVSILKIECGKCYCYEISLAELA